MDVINTLRPRQNGCRFPDDNFKCIFLNENTYKFQSRFHWMAWRRPGNKPLSEPMMVSLVMHICVTRAQWVKQGKSEGFESCDRPIVRKRPIWVKIGDVLYRVTLKFDGWPCKTIGHLSFAVSNFVQHFIAIGEFKLELQSGNAQFGSNSTIFRAVWPWNLTYDLEKQ